MKRLVVVLGGLLALPAFAEVAPFYYDGIAEYADAEMMDDGAVVGDEIVAEDDAISAPVVQPKPIVQKGTSMRTASRVTPSVTTSGNRSAGSRVVAARGTTSRAVTPSVARGTASRTQTTSAAVSPRRAAAGASVARAGTTTTTSIVQKDTVNTPLYTGRVGMRTAATTARAPSVAAVSVSNNTTVTTDAKEATAAMDNLAELTDYCKAQYTACMDNFCNVLDDNQGRCSCSKNLKNYEKTETALKAATEELQDVAQRIQYIGLTADEITTLFTQTEAELAMQNNSDSTKLKNDLDRIKNMIVGVKTGSASAIGDSAGISLDLSNLLSFNIDSTGFDLSALFGGTTSANTSSINNQRGEALYKTAAARCKAAVLNNCQGQGVDIAVISNSYDLEIDKQCIVYERGLTDSNNQMVATVRNAKTVLQKARLMVAQQKNQYDLRGCISALDSCMQDDYVCGTDYEECLDPTGKYIVDGAVVVGSMPGISGNDWNCTTTTSGSGDSATTKTTCDTSATGGLYSVWNKGGSGQNIWSPDTNNPYTISSYINDTLSENAAKSMAPKDISEFLQSKIGYHDNSTGKNYGMCISVLNKCQDYTYDKSGKYMAKNSIISNYMERAMRQIKTAQDTLLANYASSCLSDVTSCLSQNNYSFSASSSVNPSDMAIRACLPVINSCRSATLGLKQATVQIDSLEDIYKWLDAGIATSYQAVCEGTGGTWGKTTSGTTTSGTDGQCTCSNNSTQDSTKRYCVCNSGYTMYESKCIENAKYNCIRGGNNVVTTTESGTTCTCKEGFNNAESDGTCEKTVTL